MVSSTTSVFSKRILADCYYDEMSDDETENFSPSKRSKKTTVQLERLEFKDRLSEVATYPSFSDRLVELDQLFDADDLLKLVINREQNQILYVRLCQKSYKSYAAASTHLYPVDVPESFVFLEVTESDAPDATRILNVRLPPDGDAAEVIWVTRGSFASGSDLMILGLDVCAALKVNRVLLFDDAKLPLHVGKSKNGPIEKHVSLRVLLAVVNGGGFHSKFGFQPLECDKWESGFSGYFYTQSHALYSRSVSDLQKMTVKDMTIVLKAKTVLRENKHAAKRLNDLCSKYFGHDVQNGSLTIRDLAKRVYLRHKAAEGDDALQTGSDLYWVVTHLFKSHEKEPVTRSAKEVKTHYSVIRALDMTQLYIYEPNKSDLDASNIPMIQ